MIGTCNRSVSLRSVIAIIGTCTIQETNINAVLTRSRPLAANQFVKKGIKGKRRECLKNIPEQDMRTRLRVSGAYKMVKFLRVFGNTV